MYPFTNEFAQSLYPATFWKQRSYWFPSMSLAIVASCMFDVPS